VHHHLSCGITSDAVNCIVGLGDHLQGPSQGGCSLGDFPLVKGVRYSLVSFLHPVGFPKQS
jgi:hypothetical protein